MDLEKRPGKFVGVGCQKMYMDLKNVIRQHALQYLPAKSLFRFKSVCRDWKLHISIPFFAHNQSLSFRSISGLFCQTPGEPTSFLSFDAKSYGVPGPLLAFIPEPVEIRSSSNGLLCCQSCSGEKSYYICNPVTQQWKKLPKPNADHGSDPAIVLVFEPSLLNFDVYYKLVCAFPSGDFDDAIEFEIYSSSEGSWKISEEICFAGRALDLTPGVYANNVIYWKVKRGGVLAFDLIKDRSQLLLGLYTGTTGILGNMNGKLCSVISDGRSLFLNPLTNFHTNTMQLTSDVEMREAKQVVLDGGILGGDVADHTLVFADGDILVIQCWNGIYSCDLKTKTIMVLSNLITCKVRRCIPYLNSLVNV